MWLVHINHYHHQEKRLYFADFNIVMHAQTVDTRLLTCSHYNLGVVQLPDSHSKKSMAETVVDTAD